MLGQNIQQFDEVLGPATDKVDGMRAYRWDSDSETDHLFLGNASANSKDMVSKGRQAAGARNGMFGRTDEKHPSYGKPGFWLGKKGPQHPGFWKDNRGEKNPRAKVTADQIQAIYRLSAEGRSRKEIKQAVGLSRAQIGKILRGIAWPHIFNQPTET
jgi:hypothetical protein